MSKEETTPGGLLSKMVRFVRNPTTNWTELDSLQDDRESQYSKQMLKEMIERKRRNDFVRRREFDQLRKLRQREVLQGQRTEDPTARPSFFQSSMASPDERAVTLKKIDEIEAQMSQQWWKSKANADAPTQPADFRGEDEAAARAFAPTAPVSLAAPIAAAPAAVKPLFDDDSMAIGQFGGIDATMRGSRRGRTYWHRLTRVRHQRPKPHPHRRNSCTNPTLKRPPSASPTAITQGRSPACSTCWHSTSRTSRRSSWKSG